MEKCLAQIEIETHLDKPLTKDEILFSNNYKEFNKLLSNYVPQSTYGLNLEKGVMRNYPAYYITPIQYKSLFLSTCKWYRILDAYLVLSNAELVSICCEYLTGRIDMYKFVSKIKAANMGIEVFTIKSYLRNLRLLNKLERRYKAT